MDAAAPEKVLTVQEIVGEIFDQILRVIFEADDPTNVFKYDIIDNAMMKGNIGMLHKQVFVKEATVPSIKKDQQTFNKETF